MPTMIYLVANHAGADYFVPVDRRDGRQVARIERPRNARGDADFVYGEVATNTAARKIVREQHYAAPFERQFLAQIHDFFQRQATN
ncbi:hypothetical protein [Levilactobacillus zymae]|uniref:hypothetical protein n=1 Tax=Levilactobacillus zymae TaxID=267363 RepID=UPI0028BA59CC|nr:hypothetical protein [Levilactobacillus zymae]MDT6980652.1 hypothetical protein [Levilactobacillus zymae]